MRLEGGGRRQIVAGISRSSADAKWRKFIKWDLLNHLSNINSMSKHRKMRVLVLTWKSRLQEGGGGRRVSGRGAILLFLTGSSGFDWHLRDSPRLHLPSNQSFSESNADRTCVRTRPGWDRRSAADVLSICSPPCGGFRRGVKKCQPGDTSRGGG